jgi:uncharacterized protein YndB with AHSA1/START domain
MSMSLTIDRVFKTTPEKLYEVWTSEKFLSQWFGVKVDAEPKVGGTIRFHFGEEGGPVEGQYLALNPFQSLSLSWCHGKDDSRLDTTVHLTFQKEEEGARMTLRHEGFLNQGSFDAHDEGWLAYMELWSVRMNAGPLDSLRASISETFPVDIDFLKALPAWVERPNPQFKVTELPEGIKIIRAENLEARITTCRFGTCVALAEWGMSSEEQRLMARQKWQDRFAKLRKSS